MKRFAYVKETAYGITFDVIAEPQPGHLANTGRYLEHHTDLNYREKSPGLQLPRCLKVLLFLSYLSINCYKRGFCNDHIK